LRKIISLIVVTFLLLIGVESVSADTTITRLDGKDRFEVAVNVSKEGWTTSNTVVLSFYNAYADALSAAPLAYKNNAPILLTHQDNLTEVTKKEIKRLKAKKVIVVGGTGSVSNKVVNQLKANGVTSIVRFDGHDRFEVAKNIAKEFKGSSKAIIADGLNFSDALAIAPYAAKNGYPILLTRTAALPKETVDALASFSNTLVIGGEGSVSKAVFNKLKNPTRIGGQNRYDVASNIVRQLGYNTDKAFVATGTTFADALTGSVLAAKNNAPMLLSSPTYIPESIQSVIFEKQMFNLTVLGGTGSVPQDIVEKLVSYRLATVASNGTLTINPKNYSSFDQVPLSNSNQVVVFGNKIVNMTSGLVKAAPSYGNTTVNLYYGSQMYDWQRSTYVAPGAELKFIEADAKKVKVQYADKIGWVKQSEVKMYPPVVMNANRSHYESINGELNHVVNNVKTVIGKAPSFMAGGQRYYSWDGFTFFNSSNKQVGTQKQYFQFASITSKTQYTKEQFLSFVKSSQERATWEKKEGRKSPLLDEKVIDAMFKAQEDYGINALFILGAAIHESAWGVSDIATEKNNLFGIEATDIDPGTNAKKFASFEDSIKAFALDYMKNGYTNPNSWKYSGPYPGNKGSGINVWYASDPNWGSRVAGHMYKIDKALGSKEIK